MKDGGGGSKEEKKEEMTFASQVHSYQYFMFLFPFTFMEPLGLSMQG